MDLYLVDIFGASIIQIDLKYTVSLPPQGP